MISTTLRRVVLVAASAIAIAIAIACAGSTPAPADDAATPAPLPRTSSVAEQQEQAQQQDAQTTEYVADVSQAAEWPALPLTASEKADFCENLEAAVALSQARRAQWNVGQAGYALREALRNAALSTSNAAASMLDLYYDTNPPINAIFLRLAALFETTAEGDAEAAEAFNRMEASDRQLASLVRSAWAAVTDYCGS